MEITNAGYDYRHKKDFKICRPNGSGDFMLLIIRSPAYFVLNNTKYYTKGNSVVIYKKGTSQIYGGCDDEYVNDWVHFDASDEDIAYLEELNVPFNRLLEFSSVSSLSDCIKHIVFEKYSSNKNAVYSAKLYFRLFFLKISDLLQEQRLTSSELLDRLNVLRNNIYSNPQKQWKIDDIAKDFLLSKSYLQHQYKALFRTNIKSDVIKSRIEYSQYLLFSTDYTVSAISAMCGYQNDVHFMRVFKNHVGCTPTEYRTNSNFSKKKKADSKLSVPFTL